MAVKRLPSIVFCAIVSLAAALAQPLGKGLISGTAVDGESGDAIRKAIVTLTLEGTPRQWATARTDGSGHFQFEGLPAGKYDLKATKSSEGTAIYGANHLRELGDSITLGDGEVRGNITLRFLRSASVSGHVYDSDGEPVAEATVNLLRPGRNLGAPVLVNYRRTSTDDRGEYRISNIDPGRYYLRATPSGARRLPGLASGGEAMLVGQYFGGSQDSKDAAPIHVGGSDRLAGLDFRLVSEPAAQVRGRVMGVPEETESPETLTPGTRAIRMLNAAGEPAVEVSISPADGAVQRWTESRGAEGPEHRFQMSDVPAGRYRLEAAFHSGDKAYGASQVIDLHADSGEIVLTLAPAVDIQGTLRVEGPTPPRPGGNAIRVELTRPGGRRRNLSAEVGIDGRFSIAQVPPGEWQLAVTPVPPGFLKSALFGDKDVRFTTFDVSSNSEAVLKIVVSRNTATVEGKVDAETSDSTRSSKRAGIVIAPIGPYHNLARFYYGGSAAPNGKFHITGIAPGKYKIFALENMAAAGFRTPEAADQLDELGEVIDVTEGTNLQVYPKLIPADRAAQALK